MIKLLFFGSLSDLATDAPQELAFEGPTNTPKAILEILKVEHPKLAEELSQSYIQVAIDGEIMEWDSIINENSEVAFMPPFTGG